MKNIKSFRIELMEYLKSNPLLNQLTESVTIVGSFHTKDDMSAISDIDTIVIVNKLNKLLYHQIIDFFKSISLDQFGFNDYDVIVNPTFGPLKFNQENSLVFHVMIYDIEGHRKHVIDSPFTCFEWQQFPPLIGKSLFEIYPSNALALDDIAGSRRSFTSYLADLDKRSITYRSYQFNEDEVSEVKHHFDLDSRHQIEYAYHICKFLMLNILKILYQQPVYYNDEELAHIFSQQDTSLAPVKESFQQLSYLKRSGELLQSNTLQNIRTQVETISSWFQSLVESLPRIYFYRHLPTALNDGRFLGSLSNPDILPSQIATNQVIEICFSSQLLRATSTAALLSACNKIETSLLNEINYGEAEGLTYTELKEQHPQLIAAWNANEDMPFPGGENLEDVANRLNLFIEKFILDGMYTNIGVVTHNVVIRVLLSRLFSIPLWQCYRFQIPHGEAISCHIWNKTIIPAFTAEQRVKFREQYLVWKSQ